MDLEQESEEAGPPDVSEEMLAQLELEADEREISRLIPKNGNFEGYRFLTTKKVYDWRWRLKEEPGKSGWMRRSRLVGRDYKFLSPEMENLICSAQQAMQLE